MNLTKLSLPTPKRLTADSSLKPFPVDKIPEEGNEKPFTGFFNGLSVEVLDFESIKQIYSNGCFGLSTKTKNVPTMLHKFPQMKKITQSQYERKLEWDTKFIDQHPETVVVDVLFSSNNSTETVATDVKHSDGNQIERNEEEENETIQSEDIKCENITSDEVKNEDDSMECVENKMELMQTDSAKTEFELNLAIDPFPIEETLALLPVEAFFLHHSLHCLKILNFEQTHEFTTEELLERFCITNPNFIQQFIVYHFYRSKNWVVKSGLKFGGDFLLYYKGPSYYHASYVVLVSDENDEQNQLDMQSNYRVADSTSKDIILATINRPPGLEYSNRNDCLSQLNNFTITEIIPKRLTTNLLSQSQ